MQSTDKKNPARGGVLKSLLLFLLTEIETASQRV